MVDLWESPQSVNRLGFFSHSDLTLTRRLSLWKNKRRKKRKRNRKKLKQ